MFLLRMFQTGNAASQSYLTLVTFLTNSICALVVILWKMEVFDPIESLMFYNKLNLTRVAT